MTKFLSLLAAIALPAFVLAQPPNMRRPPPEAFAACQNQEEGTLCSVDTPHGQLEGTCRMPPRDVEETRLVCVPHNHERRDRGMR